MDKSIEERLKEILGVEDWGGLTIIINGTPTINVYLGSEDDV
jgi:hypothetical protein